MPSSFSCSSSLTEVLSFGKCSALLMDAPIGVYLSTPAGRFVYVNTTLALMFGYDTAQELMDAITDIGSQLYVYPQDRLVFMQDMELKNEIVNLELLLRKRDGSMFWVSENTRQIKNDQGHICYYEGYCTEITDKKLIEQKLKEQEETYRRLFETMSQGVVYQDASGRIILTNPAAERILNLSDKQMHGQTSAASLWEVVDESGSPLLSSEHPSMVALQTGQPVHGFVMGVRTGNQKEFTWISVTAIPLFKDPGPAEVYTIFEDITAQRRAETSYAMLFREMLNGFVLYEVVYNFTGYPVDFRFLDVNPAFENLTGLDRKEILGRTILDVLPNIEPVWIENFAQVAVSGESFIFEQYSSTLDQYFSVSAFCPLPGQVACVFSNITLRKQAELALVEEERKYRFLADNIDDVIWILDSEFCFTYVSPSISKLRGLTPEQAMSESLPEIMTAQSWQVVEEVKKDVLNAGLKDQDRLIRLELEQYRQDGSTVWVEVLVRPLFNAENKIDVYLGVTRDISKARAMRQQLVEAKDAAEAANKAKSEFLANMSHEIRTPLNGIMGMLQLLQMTALDQEQKKYVQLSKVSAQRLTRLLSDILDLSRVEAGKMEFLATEFSVHDLQESVMQLFVIQAQEKSIDLQCHIDADMPALLIGDEVRVRQILFNLVGNALKFTQSGSIDINFMPLVPIDAHTLPVLITIEDTGRGISQEGLQRIFQPFSQVDSSYTRTHQGAGLGLAIVRRLVELMHGSLHIESMVGQGTSVYLVLPLGLEQ